RRILWQILFDQGQIELAGGDVAAARRTLDEASSSSRLWLDLEQGSGDTLAAESAVAGSPRWLGVARGRAGGTRAAKNDFAVSLSKCKSVADRDRDFIEHKADLAEIYGFLGDLQARTGQLNEAAKSYLELRKNLAEVLNHDREDMSRQPDEARTHERVA